MLILARLPVLNYSADESTNSETDSGGTNSDSDSESDTNDSPPTKRHKASKQQAKIKAKKATIRHGKGESSDNGLTSDDSVSDSEPESDGNGIPSAKKKTPQKLLHLQKMTVAPVSEALAVQVPAVRTGQSPM